jgi:thymidine phosphorylase
MPIGAYAAIESGALTIQAVVLSVDGARAARAEARGSAADAYALGVAAWRLGAGRARKEDPVSASAGVVWTAGVGDRVTQGQPLLELRTDDAARIPRALKALEGAFGVDTDDEPLPLLLDRIEA